MELIIGGAYQGKLDYAKETYRIKDEEVFTCNKDAKLPTIDFSKKGIYKLEEFTYCCVKTGMEAKEYLEEHREELEGKIIIGTEISQGVVPMDKDMRAWREMNGRAMLYLSQESRKVTRIFCGLPQIIKESSKENKAEERDCLKAEHSYIHLIRHGTTEGNIKRWYYGSSDIPLTPEGIELLARLKTEGIYPKISKARFYTSGLLRTEQTFRAIFGNIPHSSIENLKEMRFGEFEMLTYEDLKDKPEYLDWIADKSGYSAPPGGESSHTFRKRVSEGFCELVGLHKLEELSVRHCGEEAHTVAVCHGGVISAIMAECFPEEYKNFFEWIPDPGHGYTIKMNEGKGESYTAF